MAKRRAISVLLTKRPRVTVDGRALTLYDAFCLQRVGRPWWGGRPSWVSRSRRTKSRYKGLWKVKQIEFPFCRC
jgi:hypothetical protein